MNPRHYLSSGASTWQGFLKDLSTPAWTEGGMERGPPSLAPRARTFGPRELLPFSLGLVGLGVGAIAGHGGVGLRRRAGVAAVLLFDGGGICYGALVAVIIWVGGKETQVKPRSY